MALKTDQEADGRLGWVIEMWGCVRRSTPMRTRRFRPHGNGPRATTCTHAHDTHAMSMSIYICMCILHVLTSLCGSL